MQDGFLFTHAYEWRLNMETGEAKERNLSVTDLSMEIPMVNEKYTGLKHKYGYTQVVDSIASSMAGITKFHQNYILSHGTEMPFKHYTGFFLHVRPS